MKTPHRRYGQALAMRRHGVGEVRCEGGLLRRRDPARYQRERLEHGLERARGAPARVGALAPLGLNLSSWCINACLCT